MHGHAVEHLDLHLDDVAEGQFAGAFLEADVGMPWVVADDKNAKPYQEKADQQICKELPQTVKEETSLNS